MYDTIKLQHFLVDAKIFIGVLGSGVGWFLGEIDGLIYALIAFIIVDYITGVIAAYKRKKLSSRVGFYGFFKKCIIFLIVGIANLLDIYVIKINSVFRTTVIFYYLANEGLSIIENSGKLGLPIPKKLKEALKQLKDKGDEENGSTE